MSTETTILLLILAGVSLLLVRYGRRRVPSEVRVRACSLPRRRRRGGS